MRIFGSKHITSFQIIILGFAGVILAGSLLLMLPFASVAPGCAGFADTLFTATSAVCVTGLIVQDTATYWTLFGQFIIILLIQIGGLGVVTIAVSIVTISGRKIGLMQRSTLQDAISAQKVGGIVRLTSFIFKTTFLIEGIGAAVMYPVFCRDFGPVKGLWYAVFHSISAFCNAGFDLMGVNAKFSSVTAYYNEPLIAIPIMLLIITGGIGFLTWEDIKTHRLRFRRYRMQSRVILITTAALILLPALYFFLAEYGSFPVGDRLLLSFFQSVTPRTAGFNTADLTAMSETGILIMTLLMLIGGSPGSTAGGMKTTTLAVLLASAVAVFKRDGDAHLLGRRIEDGAIRQAGAILIMYMVLFLTGGMIISRVEGLPILTCLFETGSAIGTVGLTLGITPSLSLISRTILGLLMFFGRVGGLTLIFATFSGRRQGARLPMEKITVG